MNAALSHSLRALVAAAPADRDDWVLIGSTAAHLCGIDLDPADIDILASAATIRVFANNLGAETKVSGSDRFRSTPFATARVESGLDIELLGDLHVHRDGRWQPLIVVSRLSIETVHGPVYVPSLAEQVAIFEFFGRPKDLAKAGKVRDYLSM